MAKKLQKSDMFAPIFNRIIDLCENNNITVTSLLDKFANSRSAMNAWKNGNISTELLPSIAKELNVSLDILLTGKEKNSSISKLSDEEKELLNNYNKLSNINKVRILERIKTLTEIEKDNDNK